LRKGERGEGKEGRGREGKGRGRELLACLPSFENVPPPPGTGSKRTYDDV